MSKATIQQRIYVASVDPLQDAQREISYRERKTMSVPDTVQYLIDFYNKHKDKKIPFENLVAKV